MAEHEPAPPSTRQQMEDAVQDVMQKMADDRVAAAAEVVREQKRQVSRRRQAAGLVVFGIVTLILALVISLPRLRNPFPAPTGADAERDARAALLFAAGVVDSYRAAQSRLPESLLEAGVALPGMGYSRTADGYELVVQADGVPVSLRSTDDRAAFSSGRTPAEP